MASSLVRSLLSTASYFYQSGGTRLRIIHTASTNYGSRKGTRAKAKEKKLKAEIAKAAGSRGKRTKGQQQVTSTPVNKHLDDSFKKICTDDVYPMKYFRWIVYTADQAIDAHKETHHPTMYNDLNAYILAQVELNMKAVKKNRYLDNFSRIVLLPHAFPRDEQRTILAFGKGQDIQKQADEAGATTAGGVEIIKKIQDGELKLGDYEYVVAHPNILTDLVPIRGLLKRKFPNLRSGTLDQDLPAVIKKFAAGLQYKTVKDEHQEDYACIEAPVGRLNMETKHIAENIEALIKDIDIVRPKREGLFITRCCLVSPPSTETLKIDPFVYVKREYTVDKDDESDDDEEQAAASA